MILEKDFIPKNEFVERIKRHQSEIRERGIDFSIIQYKSDLYYYSGTGQSCILVIPREEEPILFARRVMERVKEESAIDNIVPIRRTKELYNELKERDIEVEEGKLGLEGDVLPAEMYLKIAQIFPKKEAVSIGMLLRILRSVKSKNEIEAIRGAAKILDEVHENILEIIKPGMTEIEASGKLYAEMRKLGAQAAVRSRDFYTEAGGNGMILSGTNSGIASYTLTATAGPGLHQSNPWGPNQKKIKEEELVLVDISATYNGYIADETRCYVFGKVSDTIKERYYKAWQCEKKVAELMKEGKKVSAVYEEAYEFAREIDVEKEMMLGGEIPFLAHGVGLELNDLPVIVKRMDYVLKEGNVLAVEPKLIYPGEMTIGSENTYVVQKQSVKALTNAPHQLLE
ncbi:MAG: M24 family metallopeptidase [Candidatus Heimdallarchaeaceae archaeon]